MIELRNINVSFKIEQQKKLFGKEREQVLFDVSFYLERGKCLGILGESGSGKSTLGRVICGLLKPDTGAVFLNDISIYSSREGRETMQNAMSIVFQDYTTSANPRFTVTQIIKEGISCKERKTGKKIDTKTEVNRLLELVGLDESYASRFPHELSGGQLQRVCIARAIACDPQFILFDEAVSSLDAHTQVQIMDLLVELQRELKLTYIFITHDLTSITYMCDDVLFLYHGRITEQLPVRDIANVKDEYAKKLLHSIIQFGGDDHNATA